jgi:rhamnose transport system ATP-binding protein
MTINEPNTGTGDKHNGSTADVVVPPGPATGVQDGPGTSALSTEKVSKSFGGINALMDVSVHFRAGEIHALIGENGAGKSTLTKIMTGVYEPDSGRFFANGQPVNMRSPLDAQRMGIAAIYQDPLTFPDLNVAENIFMTRHPIHQSRQIAWQSIYDQTEALLRSIGAKFSARTQVSALNPAGRQLVEIAKAISSNATVLLMDEPTSSLSQGEVTELFSLMRRLRDNGVAIVFISHRLDEIMEVAQRVTVLRDGKVIEEAPIAGMTRDRLVQLMVGRPLSALFTKAEADVGEVVVSLNNLSQEGNFHDISFDLRAGEIVGLGGLVGAKRTEVAQAIFGIGRLDGGTITIDGKRVSIRNPGSALRHGIAYLPEDRLVQGLVQPISVSDNMALPALKSFSSHTWMSQRKVADNAHTWVDRLHIRLARVSQAVKELSGGNQQKVVLAKWLGTQPRIVLLDEPTRGIDVGTKAEVHAIIAALAGEGRAVLLISSELPELLAMSDRVIVMREGEITGRFTREQATPEKVMTAALGLASEEQLERAD